MEQEKEGANTNCSRGSGKECFMDYEINVQHDAGAHGDDKVDDMVKMQLHEKVNEASKRPLFYSRNGRPLLSNRGVDLSSGHKSPENAFNLSENNINVDESMHDHTVDVEKEKTTKRGKVPTTRCDRQTRNSNMVEDASQTDGFQSIHKAQQIKGAVTEYSAEGSMLNVTYSTGRSAMSADKLNASKKRKNKFEDRLPPYGLTPDGKQKTTPLGVNKDVWVLHPTRVGSPVAIGKTGHSFKTTKAKLQSSPWRSVNWETGMQLVEIQKVFQSGVKIMHPSKQPNKSIKLLDDVQEADCAEDALVMWGSDYLVEVSKNNTRKEPSDST
ncbi:hypothetical protein M758_UG264000 [Ceratodon purpureus]|nr:hypothetical protein M758_UG264000 [Ceratodon purpureus]